MHSPVIVDQYSSTKQSADSIFDIALSQDKAIEQMERVYQLIEFYLGEISTDLNAEVSANSLLECQQLLIKQLAMRKSFDISDAHLKLKIYCQEIGAFDACDAATDHQVQLLQSTLADLENLL